MKPPVDPEHLRIEAKKIKERTVAFNREVVDKMSALATAAFGLVAALAWNGAIQALFKRWYPQPDDPNAIMPLVGYAVFVTVVAVLIILWIGRVAGRLKNMEKVIEARK
jgi:membrane protein YdbS with pleckstrin-like domain